MSKKKSSPETQENLTPTTTPADSTAKDNSLNNPLRIEGIYPFPLMYALKCAHFIKGERITEKEEVRGIATATTEEENCHYLNRRTVIAIIAKTQIVKIFNLVWAITINF